MEEMNEWMNGRSQSSIQNRQSSIAIANYPTPRKHPPHAHPTPLAHHHPFGHSGRFPTLRLNNISPPGLEHDEVAHWLINRTILDRSNPLARDPFLCALPL
jgi:hypothetical protein